MAISKKIRQIVWNKSQGICWYCGTELPEKGWHVDHVQPVLRQSEIVPYEQRKNPYASEVKFTGTLTNPDKDNVDNMVPACAPCNLFKSTFSLEEFRQQIAAQPERGSKSSVNVRTAERFGLIKVVDKPVVFWFEESR